MTPTSFSVVDSPRLLAFEDFHRCVAAPGLTFTDDAGDFLPGVPLGCLRMWTRITHPTAARITIPAR
jgi:hypothetical protein